MSIDHLHWLSSPEMVSRYFLGKDGRDRQGAEKKYKDIEKDNINRTKLEKLQKDLDKQFQEINQEKLAFTNPKKIPWQEYLAGGQFSDPTKSSDPGTQASRQDGDRQAQEMNHTLAWFFRKALEQMGQERISRSDFFKKSLHFAQQGTSRTDEINDMHSTAKQCQHLSELAQSKQKITKKRIEEANEPLKHIKKLIPGGLHLLPASLALKKHSDTASERAKSLEKILNDMKSYREETDKLINVHISKAQQRLAEDKKRFENIQNRYQEAKNYADNDHNKRLKILDKRQKDTDEDRQKRATEAKQRAEVAKQRATEAKQRAEVAEQRAKRAKELGLDSAIDEKASKDARKSEAAARSIANLENDLAVICTNKVPKELENDKLSEIQKASNNEKNALGDEKDAVPNQQKQTEKEKKALEEIVGHLLALENSLKTGKDCEEAFGKTLADFFGENNYKLKDRLKLNAQKETVEKQHASVIDAEDKLHDKFKNFQECEKEVAKAIWHNAIDMEREEDTNYFGEATKCLEELKAHLVQEDIQFMDDETQAFLPFDVAQGKVTIGGVWLSIRNIFRWDFSVPDQVSFVLRPDLADIKIFHQVTDGTTLKSQEYQVETKRVMNNTIHADKFDITIDIPDNLFEDRKDEKGQNIGRRKASVTILDKETQIPTIEYIDNMEFVKSIHIRQIQPALGGTPTYIVNTETQTMPEHTFKYEDARKTASGFENPETVRNMPKIHLPSQSIIFPGLGGRHFAIKLADLDWTETGYKDRQSGLKFQTKGPTQQAVINALMANRNLLPLEKMHSEQMLQSKTRDYAIACINFLEEAHKTGNREIISQAYYHIMQNDAFTASTTAILKKPFESPPIRKQELDDIRQIGSQEHAAFYELMKEHNDHVATFQRLRQDVDTNMQDRLKKHLDTERQKELWNEICEADHLSETFKFELMENPGAATALIMEISKNVGIATKTIEEVLNRKSSEVAIEAQNKVEQETFNDINQALNTYRAARSKNLADNDIDASLDEDQSLQDFHTALRKAIYRATYLQAKAYAAKSAQNFANIISESPMVQAEKDDFVQKATSDRAKQEEEKIIRRQTREAQDAIQTIWADAIKEVPLPNQPTGSDVNQKKIERRYTPAEIKAKQRKAQEFIENAAKAAREDASTKSKDKQHRAGALAATKLAFILAKGYITLDDKLEQQDAEIEKETIDKKCAELNNDNKTKEEFDQKIQEIEEEIDQKIRDTKVTAEKTWHDNKEYGFIAAIKATEKIEQEIKAIRDEAVESDRDAEIAEVKAASRLATIEAEKLEVIRAEFAASKAQGKNNSDAWVDAYNEIKILENIANGMRIIGTPVSGTRQAHFWIDPDSGLMKLPDGTATPVHCYLQDIQQIGDAVQFGQGRDTHTGIRFKSTLKDPVSGITMNDYDVQHTGLCASDDAWNTRIYIHFRQKVEKSKPDGNTPRSLIGSARSLLGSLVGSSKEEDFCDMLYLPNGMGINLKHINWDKTRQSDTDGIVITLLDNDTVPENLRGCKINLKEAASRKTLEQQNEAMVKVVIREATRKCIRAQAVKDVANSARTIADLQGLSKEIPANDTISPYDKAINAALSELKACEAATAKAIKNNLKRSLADTADGSSGDADEKSAAKLVTVQRYAEAQKRITEAVKNAVQAAKETAGYLDKDVTKAEQRAAHVVKRLAYLAQMSTAGAGGYSFQAAAIAAEEAAATQVAITQSERKAIDAVQRSERLADIEQERTARRVTESIEFGSTAAGKAAGTALVNDSRREAQDAAREYARLRGDANLDAAAEAANQVINDKIAEIDTRIDTDITENEINDKELRNEVINAIKDAAHVKVAAQWSLVEQAKLYTAIAAQDCLRAENITDGNQLKTAARDAINNVNLQVTEAIRKHNQHPVKASAAAVVAAYEYSTLLRSKAMTAEAEKIIAILAGENDATQIHAVHQVLGGGSGRVAEGTIDAIHKQGGLVAVIRHTGSRIQVKEAVVKADRDARQRAAHRGLPELTPANPGDPTQATEGRAAARFIRDQAQTIRNGNKSDPNAQDIQSAEAVAPGAGQAITNAISEIEMIQVLARASNEVIKPMVAQTSTAERYAADEAEMLSLIQEAENPELAFKAIRDATMRFQTTKQATQAAQAIAKLTEGDEHQAVNKAKKDIEAMPDLVDATRYAASLDRVAKAVTKAAKAARAAAPNPQRDAHALDAAQMTEKETDNVRKRYAGNPVTQDIEAAIAAERSAESYVQIEKAVQCLIDADPADNDVTKRANAQANIESLHNRVVQAQNYVNADKTLDPAIHRAKFAARAAQNILDGAAANAAANVLDADTDATNAQVRDAQYAIHEAGRAAGEAVIDASDQLYAVKPYHGDRDEEYQFAIKTAKETLVAQKKLIIRDGEAIEKSGAIASNMVKISASQASQELMQEVTTKRMEELEQARDPNRVIQRPHLPDITFSEEISQKSLDVLKNKAEKNANEAAKNIAISIYGNRREWNAIKQDIKKFNIMRQDIKKWGENVTSTFNSIVRDTERMSWLRGEDQITRHAAVAEAVTSYTAYLTELAKATKIASRDAAAIENLTGRRDRPYAREAAKAVLLRADIARHEAVLEGKSQIDQYAAAAAAARRFAEAQAECKQSAQAAAKAAKDRAQAEGLPTNADPNDRSQETEKQETARKVIDAFTESRTQAAQAKIKQAYTDLVIFAREMAETRGDSANVQTIVDNILGEPAVPGGAPRPGSVKAREQQARNELKLQGLGDEAAIEEGVAQVIAAQVAIVRAKRDVARSVKAWAEVQGVPNIPLNVATPNITARTVIIQQEIDYIDAQSDIGRTERGGNVLDQDIVASEIATFMAARQHAIESATKDASVTAERKGLPLGVAPGLTLPLGTTQLGDAQIIENQIMTAIEGARWTRVNGRGVQRAVPPVGPGGIITHEINEGGNHLNAHRFAAEFAVQVASTQRSRLIAACSAQNAAHLAGLPTKLPRGAGPNAKSKETEARAAVDRIDRATRNNHVDSFLPAGVPGGYEDILRAPIKARLALRAATIEVKIAQAVQQVAEAQGYVTSIANRHMVAANRATAVDLAKETAVLGTLDVANAVLTARGGTPEKALAAVFREADAYAEIANYAKNAEACAQYSQKTAGGSVAAQDQAGQEAVQRLLNAANNARTAAVGRNPTLEAVQAAKKSATSEAQIKKAVEQLVINDQPSAEQNARDLLTRVTGVRTGTPPDPDVAVARAAAQAANNIIEGRGNNLAYAHHNATAKADEAEQAILKEVAEVSRIFDGIVVADRDIYITHTLENIEAVARNPEVAQAMNDAGRSAAAAEEQARLDITDPTPEEIAAEAEATNIASQTVLRSAIAARQVATAERLSKSAIESRESEAASSTAARFISRHTVAVSAREVEAKKTVADLPNAINNVQAALGTIQTNTIQNLALHFQNHRTSVQNLATALDASAATPNPLVAVLSANPATIVNAAIIADATRAINAFQGNNATLADVNAIENSQKCITALINAFQDSLNAVHPSFALIGNLQTDLRAVQAALDTTQAAFGTANQDTTVANLHANLANYRISVQNLENALNTSFTPLSHLASVLSVNPVTIIITNALDDIDDIETAFTANNISDAITAIAASRTSVTALINAFQDSLNGFHTSHALIGNLQTDLVTTQTALMAAQADFVPLRTAQAAHENIKAAPSRAVRSAIDNLDYTLSREAAKKAGLWLREDGELMLDPAAAADSLINEGKVAIRQSGQVSGQSATQQKENANNFQEGTISQANEVKDRVATIGGDEVEGTLAAVAFIERRVAIERACKEAVLACWETQQLIDEDEEEKNEAVRSLLSDIHSNVQTSREAAKEQGLNQLTAQIAAGAAKATKRSYIEKNVNDAIRSAKASMDPKDRKAQIDAAKKAHEQWKQDMEAAEAGRTENIISISTDLLQKYINDARRLKENAYQMTPPGGNPPFLPQLYNVPDKNTLPANLQADHANWQNTYDTNEQELTAIINESNSNLIEKYKSEMKLGRDKDTIYQFVSGISATIGNIALIESTKELQNIKMRNITPPAAALIPDSMKYNEDLRSARISAEKEMQAEYDKAFTEAARENIGRRHARAAAAVKSYVLIEKAAIKAKDTVNTSLQATRPIIGNQLVINGVPIVSPTGGPVLAAQEHIDNHNKQIEDAKIAAEVRVRNAAKISQTDNVGEDPINRYAIAAQAADRAAGSLNSDASFTEVYKAALDVTSTFKIMQDTARIKQYTFNASLSNAYKARTVRIEQAVKDLTPAQAQKVRDDAKQAQKQAKKDKKDLIEQHAEAAAEAAIAKANRGTDIQTTTAKNAARLATAQAEIAQAIQVVGSRVHTRVGQVVGASATAVFGGIRATPGEQRVDYQARVERQVMQLVAKNIMQLVAAIQAATPAGTDPVTVLESSATAVRAYIAGFVGEDALPPNRTAATGAKGLAARAQHYASKGTNGDTATKEAGATDGVHHRNSSETAAFLMAEDAVIISSQISDTLSGRDLIKNTHREQLQRTITTLKDQSRSHKGNNPQKSKETIEALIKVVAEQDGLARDLQKVADAVEAGANVTGLNVKHEVSKFAREVRNAAIEKQRDVLTAELATTLKEVHESMQALRNQAPINGYTNLAPNTLNNLLGEADNRIQAEYNRPLDPAKDLITQYTERIAAVRAQGAIESARIKIITSMEEASVVSGWPVLTTTEIRTKNEVVDTIVQEAKRHADPDNQDIIQQYIAAAATAQKLASLQEQFHEVIIQTAGSDPTLSGTIVSGINMTIGQLAARNIYDSSMYTSQTIHELRHQAGTYRLIQQHIAILDFAKRKQLIRERAAALPARPAPTEVELSDIVRDALQTSETIGDEESKKSIDAIREIQDQADKASRDGAKQAAELGRTVGETLTAIATPAKNQESAISTKKNRAEFLVKHIMDLDRQIDKEGRKTNQSLDDRIQKRITMFRQAAKVLPKRANDIEAADEASQALAEFAGLDKEIEASKTKKSLEDVFRSKLANINIKYEDSFLHLAAAGDAVTQVAEITIARKKRIEVFIKEVHRDLERTIITEDQKAQIIKKAVKDILEQVDQAQANAKAAHQDFSIHYQTAVLRNATLKARLDVISSTETIDKTVTKMAQEMNDAAETTIKLRELTGPQLIEAYVRYEGSSNLAEQAERQKIEDFIDDEANGVHSYYRDLLNLRRALAAALRGNYHDSVQGKVTTPGEVYMYLKRLTPNTEVHTTEQGALRAALQNAVRDAINSTIDTVRIQGMDDLMIPVLVRAIEELTTRSRNLKLAAKAANPETTLDEAKKYVKDMTITEVQSPDPVSDLDDPDAKDGKTKAKAVPLDEKFVTYKRKGPRQWDFKGRPGRRQKIKTFDFKALERMSPDEKVEYANEVSDILLASANAMFDKSIAKLDTEQRFLMIQKRGEWVDKYYERLSKFHSQSEAMQFQLYKLRLFRTEMNRQRWKDLMAQWALLCLKNSFDGASKGVNTFMAEFQKIMMKAVG